MSDGGGLTLRAGGPTEGGVLPLQVQRLVRLGLADSPHPEHGVAVGVRAVGDGQAGLAAGEDDELALHTPQSILAWLPPGSQSHLELGDPVSLLHHDPREVVQRVEETEQDGLVGVEILLQLLRDLTFHQQPKLAGPAAPHWELERHVELLALRTSRRHSLTRLRRHKNS